MKDVSSVRACVCVCVPQEEGEEEEWGARKKRKEEEVEEKEVERLIMVEATPPVRGVAMASGVTSQWTERCV